MSEPRRDEFFGRFFDLMKASLTPMGSELGLGMTLFSLAVSTRAGRVVEIGRHKGFSTLCLGSALRFLDEGWEEPTTHKERPDVDYAAVEAPRKRRLYSIDPAPTEEARAIVAEAGLVSYVEFLDCRSDEVDLHGELDLVFIDGDHTFEGCLADVQRFVPRVRPGGYFVLHDYFGWYDEHGQNRSPVRRVIRETLLPDPAFQHLLVDTWYSSFVVFRQPDPLLEL
jgi:predicted O-methyltransferase YrrM